MSLFLSCVKNDSRVITNKNLPIKMEKQYSLIEGIDFVILPYGKNCSWIKRIPTDENINKMLEDVIENYNKKTKESWEKEIILENYRRQYIAIINEKGEKEVCINFFRSDINFDYWKERLVEVDDGGNDYFRVQINLEKMILSHFATNGYA